MSNPRTWVLEITAGPGRFLGPRERAPWALISRNDANKIHRSELSRLRRAWRCAAYTAALRAKLPTGLRKVRIDFLLQFTTGAHRDEANYHETAKPVVDGLAAPLVYERTWKGRLQQVNAPGYLLIPGDTPAHLEGPFIKFGPKIPPAFRGHAGTALVTITDLSEEPTP